MKSCSFLLPSLPRPPHREWVVCSPSTPFTKSTTLKSLSAFDLAIKNIREGTASESGSKRASPVNVLYVHTTANAVTLADVVAMKTGE